MAQKLEIKEHEWLFIESLLNILNLYMSLKKYCGRKIIRRYR